MRTLSIFSWGYWGWGRSMAEFVRAADAVERARRNKPPLFVDIRLRRSVRARDFREDTLAGIVGVNRYRWMNDLGNLAIQTGGNMRIKNPSAANELLDCALHAAGDRRRVIFFCACETQMEAGKVSCHRHRVSTLLLGAARKRRIPLQIVEWPGGEPRKIGMDATPRQRKAVMNETWRIPLGDKQPNVELCGLPWGSTVELRGENDDERLWTVAGPAKRHGGRWYLPVDAYSPDQTKWLKRRASSFRRKHGYCPLNA